MTPMITMPKETTIHSRAQASTATNTHTPAEISTSAETVEFPAVSRENWDEIVRTYADSVYGLVYRLSGNAQDAEDLTQETFIRVFRSLDRYRPGTFEGWLHRITTNLFLDQVRHRSVLRME